MAKHLYISSCEPASGKSVVLLGLCDLMMNLGLRVAYFKPIIEKGPAAQEDMHMTTICEYFHLIQSREKSFVYTLQQALDLVQQKKQGEMLEQITSQFRELEKHADVVLVEGTDFSGRDSAFELELNTLIACTLSLPAVLVVSVAGRSNSEAIGECLRFATTFEQAGATVAVMVTNRVLPHLQETLEKDLRRAFGPEILPILLPADPVLSRPTIADFLVSLDGRLLRGNDYLGNQVGKIITGDSDLNSFLHQLEDEALVVCSGDRIDVLLATLQANQSSTGPRVAGMLLTADKLPSLEVLNLLAGLPQIVPVIAVTDSTVNTILKITGLQAAIRPEQHQKIMQAITLFKIHVDKLALMQRLDACPSPAMTPYRFHYELTEKVAAGRMVHIVLPEGNDDRILTAAATLVSKGLLKVSLLGDPMIIAAAIKRLNLGDELKNVTVIYPETAFQLDSYAQDLYRVRCAKGLTIDAARDLATDPSYFGILMVEHGDADAMVSGAVNTTRQTIRPALQIIKTAPGISRASSFFLMCLKDRVLLFADCAINPEPTASELAEIALLTADNAERLGINPYVAMLSYASGESGVGQEVEKVKQAVALVKTERPSLLVEGPMQYDAAVDPVVGQQKMPGSSVAGRANVLIFPDLNTGNTVYKAVQREAGAWAIGPVMQGINKPISDLSRGATVTDILNTLLLTALQVQTARANYCTTVIDSEQQI